MIVFRRIRKRRPSLRRTAALLAIFGCVITCLLLSACSPCTVQGIFCQQFLTSAPQ